MAISAQQFTMVAMRVSIFFYFCVGIALIAFGCTLLNPPAAWAPGAFVALGSLNLLAATAGFWGSYNKKRVLLVFIAVGGFSTLLQIAFVITLFTSFESVSTAIKEHSNRKAADLASIDKQLNIMRWVSIGFIFIELLTLAFAAILKWAIKGEAEYRGFDNDHNEERLMAMSTLRSDIESGGTKETAYDKVSTQMKLKYGAGGVGGAGGKKGSSDWKSKVQLSFA